MKSGQNNKTEQLRMVRDEVLNLKESPLYAERVRNKVFPVIGEGNHDAHIMFVGEAPGKNEAATGKPFCGASGKILDELLASIQIPRSDVYVTNIVKDRPTQNRDPFPNEIEIYAPFLDRQIDIIEPRVVATLGRFSMTYLFNKFDLEFELSTISVLHGKTFDIKTKYGEAVLIPLYHPAVAIYNNNMKPTLLNDFQTLKKYV